MPKWLIFVIIIVVLVLAVFIRVGASRRGTQEEVEQIVVVEVMPVSKGNVKRTCEVIGTINADKNAQVFPETMGRITKIFVKEGSYVSKNNKIMAIRNETIGFDYEEGFIRAPISGNVGKILVDVGSMVAPQTPVAIVVEFSKVKVTFNMSENDVACVNKGRKVSVEIDAMPDRPFNGNISEVSPVIDPFTRTVGVKALINNSKKLLKPGMTARVKLNLGEKKNALRIPKEALLDSYLFVVIDSTAKRRDVRVGLVGDKNVEILSGIEEGEKVIVVGQQRLAGGEKVNAVLRSE
jgi:multidrug efflux pump subunit AcrA (membrane-fusion protein)